MASTNNIPKGMMYEIEGLKITDTGGQNVNYVAAGEKVYLPHIDITHIEKDGGGKGHVYSPRIASFSISGGKVDVKEIETVTISRYEQDDKGLPQVAQKVELNDVKVSVVAHSYGEDVILSLLKQRGKELTFNASHGTDRIEVEVEGFMGV